MSVIASTPFPSRPPHPTHPTATTPAPLTPLPLSASSTPPTATLTTAATLQRAAAGGIVTTGHPAIRTPVSLPQGAPPAGRKAAPPSRGVKRRAHRSCGPCNACCVAPSIPDLDKPMDVPCAHLKQGAKGCCSNYENRPAVCRSFLCGWRLGLGEMMDRPDLLGVMVQPTRKSDGTTLMAFIELRPGAMDTRRAQSLMVRWAAATEDGVTVRRAQSPHFVSIPVTIERREVAAGAAAAAR